MPRPISGISAWRRRRFRTSCWPRSWPGRSIPRSSTSDLKIVRLYLQMDRYQEAQAELAQIIKDFPEHAEQFERTERELTQCAAQRMLNEIQVRRDAGQHQFAIHWLNNFPHEGVAGEILQKVKQTLEGYQGEFARGKLIVNKIKELLALDRGYENAREVPPDLRRNRGRIESEHARPHDGLRAVDR